MGIENISFNNFFYNGFHEKLEKIGDITLNHEYWDCDCEKDFIHSNTRSTCNKCNYERDESPNSRENEIIIYLDR